MVSVSLVFDHRNRTKNGEPGSVEVRVIVNRKSYYINTGVRVMKNQWKFGQVINHEQGPELTAKANIIARKVLAYTNECEKTGKEINIADLRKAVESTVQEGQKTAFLEWCVEQGAMLNVEHGTYKHYQTLFTRLHEFGMTAWDDVTAENIIKFDAWLHKRKNTRGEPIGDAAAWNYHKQLSAMLNRAVVIGKIDANPYTRLKGQFKRGTKENLEYLTDAEMDTIRTMDLRPGSEASNARDLFVFQMYTGLAYSDAQAFNINDYKEIDGQWRNVGTRIKTGVPYVSVLLPPVIEVLQRHKWKVPKMSNQAYNRMLKALGVLAGITIPLHSHTARHTFATWMLRNGAKIENVSKMLGHTNITQTQRYAKVLAESVQNDYTMMAKKLTK